MRKIYQKYLQHLTQIIIVCNPDGQIVFQNATAKKIFGDQNNIQSLEKLISKPKRINLNKVIKKINKKPNKKTLELTTHYKKYLFDTLLIPISDSENKTTEILLSFDIVKEKTKKTSLLKSFFHELKQPLTLIRAYCYQLLQYLPQKTTSLIDYIAKIDNQVLLMGEMSDISSFDLEVTTIQAAPVNTSELLQEVIQDFELAYPNYIFQLKLPKKEFFILSADRKILRHTITNLISNAMKYSGTFTPIIISMKKTNKSFKISVTDFGIGIRTSMLTKIFAPNFRADTVKHQNGSGLGLTFVYQAMKYHGGTVHVSSRFGLGSTFTLDFPLELEVLSLSTYPKPRTE